MLLFAAALFDAVLALAILRMVRQARAYASLSAAERGSAPPGAEGWPALAVVVPARDEADVVGRCIGGLLAQDYPGALSVVLVDDGSTDGTAAAARAAAGADPRFRVVAGGPLPRGWTGKAHACARGAAEAGAAGWLCFMDADTRAEPALLRTAVAHSLARGLGLLSLEPFQELGGPAERLVIPCGLYLVAATGDHAAVNAPEAGAAAANGQFLLFGPGVHARVGGHAAVRAEICEDLALARLVKRHGLSFRLMGAETLIRTRMYRDAAALWHGLSKNGTALGGGAARTVLIAAGGFLMAVVGFALPAVAAARLLRGGGGADIAAALLAFGGLFAALGLHVAGTRHFKIPIVYGLLFPLGYGLALTLALNAARLQRLGRVRWKDRTVDASTGATS